MKILLTCFLSVYILFLKGTSSEILVVQKTLVKQLWKTLNLLHWNTTDPKEEPFKGFSRTKNSLFWHSVAVKTHTHTNLFSEKKSIYFTMNGCKRGKQNSKQAEQLFPFLTSGHPNIHPPFLWCVIYNSIGYAPISLMLISAWPNFAI